MTETALFTSPMARKKRVYSRYNPNTYRVLSTDAEYIAHGRPEWSSPNKLPNANVIGQNGGRKHFPEYRHNRPNPNDVGFLRQDVALLNEPICDVQTSSTRHEQHRWWPNQAAEKIKPTAEFTLGTTIRNDYQWRGQGIRKNTRHSSNPNTTPALGAVPVNFLREPNGQQRLWKEGISYEHQFNCRNDPSYPIRAKRHGSFVWDVFSPEESGELLKKYGYSNNQQETSVKPQKDTPAESKEMPTMETAAKQNNMTEPAPVTEPVQSDQTCKTDAGMPPVEN